MQMTHRKVLTSLPSEGVSTFPLNDNKQIQSMMLGSDAEGKKVDPGSIFATL